MAPIGPASILDGEFREEVIAAEEVTAVFAPISSTSGSDRIEQPFEPEAKQRPRRSYAAGTDLSARVIPQGNNMAPGSVPPHQEVGLLASASNARAASLPDRERTSYGREERDRPTKGRVTGRDVSASQEQFSSTTTARIVRCPESSQPELSATCPFSAESALAGANSRPVRRCNLFSAHSLRREFPLGATIGTPCAKAGIIHGFLTRCSMTTKEQMTDFHRKTSLFSATAFGALCFVGCDSPRTEKVLDIETPGTNIEVHKTETDSEPDKKVIDIEAPGTDVEVNKTDPDGDAKVKVKD